MDAPRATDAPYDLERFTAAQRDVYDRALAEIVAGRKQSHWMWFIFPQVDGLGSSAMSKRYAIRSIGEAKAYLEHPILGPRLRACAEAVMTVRGKTASEIFGTPDDMKLRSSATLFAAVEPAGSVFNRVLVQLFDGRHDDRTLERIAPTERA